VTVPDAFEAGEVIRVARLLNPQLEILARASSSAGVTHLREQGADFVVSGENEMARGMLDRLHADHALTEGTPAV